MIRRPDRVVALLVALLLLPPLAGAAGEQQGVDAQRVIEKLDARFLDVMKRADELGYSGRRDAIAPTVKECFDAAFMARAVVGRHWLELSDEDKRRWLEAFETFLVSTFAHRFDGYSGQTFEVLGHKAASQNTLTVMTRLTRPNDDDVRLDYRMRERADGWKIVDIYSNGKVSEVATRHAEAASLLKEGGIEKLIESTTEVTERHASE